MFCYTFSKEINIYKILSSNSCIRIPRHDLIFLLQIWGALAGAE